MRMGMAIKEVYSLVSRNFSLYTQYRVGCSQDSYTLVCHVQPVIDVDALNGRTVLTIALYLPRSVAIIARLWLPVQVMVGTVVNCASVTSGPLAELK
jgi:hypothetical protein